VPRNRSERLEHLLRNIFLVIAVLLVAYAAAFTNYLHAVGQPPVQAKMIWLAGVAAIFFGVAAFRLPLTWKFRIFAVLLALFFVEILLQATAWLGVLPAVNTKIKVPYARIYWTSEGRGNGIRNRYGWYYPAFDLKASHRIVYIGDSQVEALEVPRNRNQAADLQALLKAKAPDWSVLGMGNYGTCVAHSIEVLDYACRHFQPQEAVIVVSVGSDVTESSPKLVPVDHYIYYDFDASGRLVMDPACEPVRNQFNAELELCHRSVLITAPAILNTHCMLLQLVDSLRDHYRLWKKQKEILARGGGQMANGFFQPTFATDPSPDVQHAMQILFGQLQHCRDICDQHGMKFRVVTIPAFPSAFYETQHGTNWTTHLGEYDYSRPEREIAAWAHDHDVPVVAMGEVMRQKKLSAEEIHGLYYANGTGHLTPKGHALVAQAVYDAWYAAP